MIYVYTGDGEGKTHIALGMALRAAGHEQKTVIIQFMKAGRSGENRAAEMLKPYVTIKHFGSQDFVDRGEVSPGDRKHAREAMDCARQELAKEPDMLVLDEANIAMDFGLVEVEDVLDLLGSKPEDTVVVLTGRNAPDGIIEVADMVSEIRKVKHPYDRGVEARKGVEY